MLNDKLKLAEKMFTDEVEKVPTRDGAGKGLVEAAEADERIVALCADLTESTRMHWFAEKFPERFVQIGIAEQNLVTVASGMAAAGKIPFASSYAAFCPGRCWEQIRTTICYNDRPVKIMGSHAGISVGPDGATHQMLEDLALMRALPNMTVLSPCDVHEAKKAAMAAAKIKSPVYIRLGREKTPVMTTEETPFEVGKSLVFREGKGVTIVATGPLVYEALKAGEELDGEVINVCSIKPFDIETLLKSVEKTGKVVTVEEHQVNGGLGGLVAEVLAENRPTPMRRIGMRDRFGESGNPDELAEHFEMNAAAIVKMARELLG